MNNNSLKSNAMNSNKQICYLPFANLLPFNGLMAIFVVF